MATEQSKSCVCTYVCGRGGVLTLHCSATMELVEATTVSWSNRRLRHSSMCVFMAALSVGSGSQQTGHKQEGKLVPAAVTFSGREGEKEQSECEKEWMYLKNCASGNEAVVLNFCTCSY